MPPMTAKPITCRDNAPAPLALASGTQPRMNAKLVIQIGRRRSFAFILGCVPLAKASGAGALSRQVMGFAVIGGMTAASFIAIFLIPVCFYVVEKLSGKKHAA